MTKSTSRKKQRRKRARKLVLRNVPDELHIYGLLSDEKTKLHG